MKILSVEAEAFVVPLPRHFNGSNYKYTHKRGIFILAKTDEGIDGFGLGQNIAKAVNEDFAKILIGRDPSNFENIWQDTRPLVRDILGDRRVALHAQALARVCRMEVTPC